MIKMGRPIKGTCRRAPITVHVPLDLVAEVDDYVALVRDETGACFTRSDFFTNSAREALERTKSVLENFPCNANEENTDK